MANQHPYAVPTAYMPVDSDVPQFQISGSNQHVAASVAAESARHVLAGILLQLRRDVVARAEFDAYVQHATAVVRQTSAALRHHLTLLAVTANQITSDAVTEKFISEGKREEYEQEAINYVIYDRYFRTVRVERLSPSEFLAQVLDTFSNVLSDIPYSQVSLAEAEALIAAMVVSLDTNLTGIPASGGSDFADLSSFSLDEQAGYWFLDGLSGPARRIRNHIVATYRWIVGHHIFNLFGMLCANRLQRSKDQVSAITEAAILLRGTTAAMWYAASMPSKTYCEDIRPQMISAKSPAGFSGNQNIEYQRLKLEKRLLVEAVEKECISAGRWLKTAVARRTPILHLLELDAEDAEHHILIASQLVGTSTPAIAELNEDGTAAAAQLSAVAQLREISKTRAGVLSRFAAYGIEA